MTEGKEQPNIGYSSIGGAPPPPPGYNQQPGGGAPPPPPSYVYNQQPGAPPVVYAPPRFRESPVRMRCPHCQCEITTERDYVTGTVTWIASVGLCIFGLGLGCCLIPFCINAAKDVIHTCPNCHQEVGRYNRMS